LYGNVPRVVMTPIAAFVSLPTAPAIKLVTHPVALVEPPPPWDSLALRAEIDGSIGVANDIARLVPASPAVISISSTTSGDLGELTVPPVIVLAYPVDLHVPAPGEMIPGPAYADQGAGSFVASGTVFREASPTTSGASTAQSSNTTVSLPAEKHVEVDGLLESPQNSVTLQIPVGPMTHSVGFSVHGGSVSGPLPVFDQMALVEPDGTTLAQLGPLWNPRSNQPADDVTVSLNGAPMGGTLIVQLSAASNGAAGPGFASSASSGAPDGMLPFVMDVQRLDSASGDATGASNSSASGFSGGGGTVIGVLPQAGNPRNLGSAGSQATAGVDHAGAEPGGSTLVVAHDPAGLASSSDEATYGQVSDTGFSGRIATGPLAARSAAPLGPNLATVLLDEAPAVDRHERALSQEIAANDEGHDTPGLKTLPDHPDADATRRGKAGDPEDFPAPDGNRVTIAGLGALPMKVSGSAGGDRTVDLDALLAALSGLSGKGDRPDIAEGEGQATDQFLAALAVPISSENDRRPAPDFLTSACVLALGMGLVTGPVIPDLLRLIPSRSSRWHIVPAGAGRPSRGAGSRKNRLGRRTDG
jgi:hypothetical protein